MRITNPNGILLYDYFRSSACFRVRIALGLKNICYEKMPIDLLHYEHHQNKFKLLNPQSLVPVLVDGDKKITQSLAIIDYLETLKPHPRLIPLPEDKGRSFVLSISQAIVSDIHPLGGLRIMDYCKENLHIENDEFQEWRCYWSDSGMSAIETTLIDAHLSDTYCLGNKPTLADVCLVPQVYSAKRFGCDIKKYPLVYAIYQNCLDLPAFQEAFPSKDGPSQ